MTKLLKSLFSLIILFTLSFSLSVNAKDIKLSENSNKFVVTSKSLSEFSFVHYLSEINTLNVKKDSYEFVKLIVEGYSYNAKNGNAELPVIQKLINVPFGADIEVSISKKEQIIISLSDYGVDNLILPSQPSLSKSENAEDVPFYFNEDYYDLNDFPQPAGNDSIPPVALKTEFKNQFKPSQYSVGFNYELTQLLNVQTEFSSWSDVSKNKSNILSNINYQLSDYNHFNISAIKFARDLPRFWYEALHFRSGVFFREYHLNKYESNENNITQHSYNDIGLSVGIGVKFGLTKNQLDFGLNFINRSDSFNSDKFITNFNIGLTIGDIWFVKRRAKK